MSRFALPFGGCAIPVTLFRPSAAFTRRDDDAAAEVGHPCAAWILDGHPSHLGRSTRRQETQYGGFPPMRKSTGAPKSGAALERPARRPIPKSVSRRFALVESIIARYTSLRVELAYQICDPLFCTLFIQIKVTILRPRLETARWTNELQCALFVPHSDLDPKSIMAEYCRLAPK